MEQSGKITVGDFFRIPHGIAVAGYTLAFVLVALSIHENKSVVDILLLVLIGGGFFLSLLERWWNEAEFPRSALRLCIIAGVIVRVAMLTTPPFFSDDVYRYAWEGRVVAAGENPYDLAPNDESLAPLRDAAWEHVNNKEISAIYPPLVQYLFAGVALAGGGVYALKLLFVLVDLLVAWLLWKWILRSGIPPGRIVVWLLHPLVIIEFAGSGHLDVLVVLGFAVTLLFVGGTVWKSSLGAISGLALGTLAKLIPLAFVPHLARHIPRRHWWMVLIPPIFLLVSYLPFASAGGNLFRAMDHYESRWSNNASAFLAIRAAVNQIDPDGNRFRTVANTAGNIAGIENLDARLLKRRDDSIPGDPNLVTARLVAYLLFAVIWISVLLVPEMEWDTRWFILLFAAFILAPINHPWYLAMLIPCTIRRAQPLVLWWSMTILSIYLVLDLWRTESIWRESSIAWWLQYGGMALIACWMLANHLRRARQNAG